MNTHYRENYHFKDVPVEIAKVQAGYSTGLPVRYYDFELFMMLYSAPYKNVERLMPSKELRPVTLFPGRAGVMLCAYRYKDIAEVKPYNEWSINIPVQYGRKSLIPLLPAVEPGLFKNAGSYVHVMPVTSDEVYYLGVDLYGFPLSVGDIDYTMKGDFLTATYIDNGRHVITMNMRSIPTKPLHMKNVIFTYRDGIMNRFVFEFVGNIGIKVFGSRSKRTAASFALGDHPIAEEIRELELGRTPVALVYSDHIEGLMRAPSSSAE